VVGHVPIKVLGDDPVQPVIPELLHDRRPVLHHLEPVLGVVTVAPAVVGGEVPVAIVGGPDTGEESVLVEVVAGVTAAAVGAGPVPVVVVGHRDGAAVGHRLGELLGWIVGLGSAAISFSKADLDPILHICAD
jgi:hypothetical protein